MEEWQEKVKIYATANQLPDVMAYWSFSHMMLPLINAGLLEKLNKADFANFGFMPGTLWEDIIASVPKFKAINITPVVTDGLEGWPLCIFFDNIAQRINGDFSRVDAAITRKAKYTDPDFVQAATYIQNLVKAGVFNANLTTSDYGDARNQFGQERAAMYMMGCWEISLATDPAFSDNFHNSLDAIKFPVIRGGKGTADDVPGWFGGNNSITNSGNKALAYEYVKLLCARKTRN
jgi:raffinose/stachyose/melibiose transport system substrate-binding protein